eukprot:478997_1
MATLFWFMCSLCMMTLVRSSKYILVKVQQNWDEADQYCSTHYGTSLASIHSWPDLVEASTLCEPGSYALPYLIACSIGLNDKENERGTNDTGWVWTDGSNYDWKLWRGGAPSDNVDHDCVVLFTADHPTTGWAQRWTNAKCDEANFYSLCNSPPTLDTTLSPTLSINPSESPTILPTENPSENPSESPTDNPSKNPTHHPANHPTENPTTNPTNYPTYPPTNRPTHDPRSSPSDTPTVFPKEGSVIEIVTTIVTDSKTTFTQNLQNEPQTAVQWMIIVSIVIVVVIIIITAICRMLHLNKQTDVNENRMNDDGRGQHTVSMEVGNETELNRFELQTNDDLGAVEDLDMDQNEYVTAGAPDVRHNEADPYDEGDETEDDDDILSGVNTLGN